MEEEKYGEQEVISVNGVNRDRYIVRKSPRKVGYS